MTRKLPKNESLGDRMKAYEHATRHYLPPRMPILIRVDGKAFHTYTRNCDKPFDADLMTVMDRTAIHLANSIQGCIFAYCQSDEISLLLQTDKRETSQSYFGGNLQKIASVTASAATGQFNSLMYRVWSKVALPGIALFDARAWVMTWEDVPNYFLWRYQDWVRNSIAGLAQANFSHKELHGVNQAGMLDMLREKGINWNLCTDRQRNGMFYGNSVMHLNMGLVRFGTLRLAIDECRTLGDVESAAGEDE